MKKILIYICLIITLLINTTNVYAIDMAGEDMSAYSSNFIMEVADGQFNDPEFFLNKEDTMLEIYSYTKNKTFIYNYEKMLDTTGNKAQYYYKKINADESFEFDRNGLENWNYDIYITNIDGERLYHLYVKNAKTNIFDFDLFTEYVEEDQGGSENPEDPPTSGSVSVEIDLEPLEILHDDLMILIVLIGFFEFMKMINIIVRNLNGGA